MVGGGGIPITNQPVDVSEWDIEGPGFAMTRAGHGAPEDLNVRTLCLQWGNMNGAFIFSGRGWIRLLVFTFPMVQAKVCQDQS